MAVVNITVTPLQGPTLGTGLNSTQISSPLVFVLDDGTRYAPVKLTIGTGQTFSTTDLCALVWGGQDFFANYGAKFIKQVMAEPIATADISYGIMNFQWNPLTQKGRLIQCGNGGAVDPTGPRDDANVANGTALGNNLMTCNALIFF
jgi:hypothetical protein